MPRPKPETPRVLISLRVTPAFLRAVDQARGKVSRANWIEGVCLGLARHLRDPEADTDKTMPDIIKPPVADIAISAIGPVRPKPGARLKRT